METYITTAYVIIDEVIHILKIADDPQSIMSNAEIVTFAIVTAKFFAGNYKIARYMCKKIKLFSNVLSNSRLNRRIHNIPWDCWYAIFRFLSLIAKKSDETCYFAVDSFPVTYCQKNRIDKRKRFLQKSYIGFSATKKKYFCGIKVHMVVTNKGRPIEVHLRPGSESDINVLWSMELDIPEQAILYADGAYNSFELEDILQGERVNFMPKRGSHIKKRVRPAYVEKEISSKRQIVETAFIPNVIQNLAFRAARKSPRIGDRKRPNIKSI